MSILQLPLIIIYPKVKVMSFVVFFRATLLLRTNGNRYGTERLTLQLTSDSPGSYDRVWQRMRSLDQCHLFSMHTLSLCTPFAVNLECVENILRPRGFF